MHFRANGGRVHISYAGIDVAHGPKGAVHIARINGGREAVRDTVGNVNGFIEGVARDQTYHWAKDFFLGNTHFAVDIAEDRGLKEPSMLVGWPRGTLSAQRQLGSLRFSNLHILLG